jgi:hypothetical protein
MTKAAEAGREVTRENAAAWGGVLMLGDNPDRLAEIKADHDWYWNTFFLPFGQGYANCLIGNADQVSRQIEDAQKRLGFTEMWLQFGQGHLDPEENAEELYKFANDIIPRFSDKAEDGTWV